ncbi:MAG TPA: hypothetical protein VG944_03420 [Fimbriimonas sp.]|nr:hypothetical protein [Fimbriimonas sp.]
MRIFIANGYYDLATPYYATRYTLNHMSLDASLHGNVENGYYESGHMMHVHAKELFQLKSDVSSFFEEEPLGQKPIYIHRKRRYSPIYSTM